jgi:putative protein-disulfide isomerase
MTTTVSKLIYVGDPMCSWCWGFAPEIEDLAKDYPVEVVVGGLRPGPSSQVLDDRMADFLRTHWVEIGERTGQPFDVGFLDRRDEWSYDTEAPAVAITQLREMNEPATLDYFTTIQRAFYAEGLDVTDLDVLADLAAPFEVDRSSFRDLLATDEARKRAWGDFSRSRNWGISGFPALIGELPENQLALLARGWTQADLIRTRIESIGATGTG